MRHHPVRVGAPRDILPPPSHDADTPPALLQRSDDDFIASTVEGLRTVTGRTRLKSTLAAARTPSHVLKLFQPLQRQFHVAVTEAWCDTPGTPRLDPAKVDSAGLVLRRIRRERAGRHQKAHLEGWVRSGGRIRGWARVQRLGSELAAPLAAQRMSSRAISPSIDRELARFALEREDTLLDEHVVPMFLAPPDVCAQAKKTLFYGLVPTASAEIADVPVDPAQALGDDFGPDSNSFRNHLAGPLRGNAMRFALAGQTVQPDWLEAVDLRGFILLLRQLAGEFDAFGSTPEGRAVFAELETISLPLVARDIEAPSRSVSAGSFLQSASRVLLERDSAADGPEMPLSWPALDREARGRLAHVLSRAVARRFTDMKGQPGRFDELNAQYVLRAFVRLKADGVCPARTEWSAYSEPFVIAPWYEGGGAAPVLVPLPDVTDRTLLKSLKPNVAFALPPSLQNLLSGNAQDLLQGKGSTSGPTLGWICSFSIPSITICAFIALNVLFSILNLIFGWMSFIKICIPFPKRSEE
jgi:hypothetical protein